MIGAGASQSKGDYFTFFVAILWILPFLHALPVYVFAWLTGLGNFPNLSRITRLAEEYSSTSLATTVAIFVLFSLKSTMILGAIWDF